MDKEQRHRAAIRELVTEDEDGCECQLIVRVSGNEVEFTRGQQHPWDNEHGTGNDETWETWTMDLETLKRFIQAAQWCISKSASFEAQKRIAEAALMGLPPDDAWEQTKRNAEAFNAASMKSLDRFLEDKPDDPGYFIL